MEYSLSRIVEQLSNPNVRLEDNSAYRIDDKTLGILYASIMPELKLEQSPGLALAQLPIEPSQPELNPYKERFQERTRSFLSCRLGELVVREYTAKDFRRIYAGDIEKNPFSPNSVEYLVVLLAEQKRFEDIGCGLREGTAKYSQKAAKGKIPIAVRINGIGEYAAIYAELLSKNQERKK